MAVKIKQTPTQTLKTLRDKRQQLKAQKDSVDKQIAELNREILEILQSQGKKEWIDDGLNTQIIQAYRTTYDWGSIQADIDPEVWARVVKEVPSEDALTREIAKGNVSATLVAKHSTKEAREPYIKVDKAAAPKEEEV